MSIRRFVGIGQMEQNVEMNLSLSLSYIHTYIHTHKHTHTHTHTLSLSVCLRNSVVIVRSEGFRGDN
jgi:hypothetical protein